MKKAELEKLKGKKIGASGPAADRYGKGSAEPMDRREQRERDREMGLVPFACKLHGDLLREIHAAAQARKLSLNEITAELLKKGLKSK